ncbi:MAG TPA: DUF3795 domain-containing protein [Desulfomonilaceae bacterium]|nr:DUF3795 domain-containing protein [Desulfomonilaceae bacterium]
MDYGLMTAPCGLPCFECFFYLAQEDPAMKDMLVKELNISPERAKCKGCREENGKCGHLPMACRVYPCATRKGVQFCCHCSDFPCDLLQPYRDNAKMWHNTKVYNLCLIRKMGLEKWAETKAKSVVHTYSFGKWTL